jgi:hypothetical protein
MPIADIEIQTGESREAAKTDMDYNNQPRRSGVVESRLFWLAAAIKRFKSREFEGAHAHDFRLRAN